MTVALKINTLGEKFQDYRDPIPGDSYNWGPVIVATNIKYFTFHHSVTKQTAKVDGNWKAECDTIANLHLARGWKGVGYRFIVCSDGTVAYVGDLSHGGSAVAGMNDVMFSACFVGDFTKVLPTDAQVTSAHHLASWFLFNMPQYQNLTSWDQVKGHKEFSPTACPGDIWKIPADSLYERIKNNIPYSPQPPTPPPQPPIEPSPPPSPTPPPEPTPPPVSPPSQTPPPIPPPEPSPQPEPPPEPPKPPVPNPEPVPLPPPQPIPPPKPEPPPKNFWQHLLEILLTILGKGWLWGR